MLTIAGGALRLLARDAMSREKLRQILEDIVAECRRAGEVIRGIKSMVRKKDTDRQPADLNDVITGVIRLARSDALAHDCAIVSELDPVLPKVEADVVQLQQVFLNLILNAFEASQKVPKAQRQSIVRTERDDDSTVLASVSDFGPGLPADAPVALPYRVVCRRETAPGRRRLAVAFSGAISFPEIKQIEFESRVAGVRSSLEEGRI